MCKIYNSITPYFLCLLAGIWVYPAISQPITIDRDDMPARNQIYRMSTGDSLLLPDPGLTGADYAWDFSNLNAVIQQKDSFLSANVVPLTIRFFFPLSLTFPTDNSLVQYIATPDSLAGFALGEAYQFFEVKSNVMLGHGLGGVIQGIPLALRNQPADTIYRFPMNYGNVDSAQTQGTFAFPGVAYYEQKRKRTNEVDGWGTLETPYGAFDVLRVKTQISGRDSVQFDTLPGFGIDIPPSIEYKWLAKDEGVPVLQINVSVVGGTEIVNRIIYRDSARNVPVVSIDRSLAAGDIALYPNPASDQVQIDWQPSPGIPATVSLYDLAGRELYRKVVSGADGLLLPVAAFPEGAYLLRLESGNQFYAKKLVIRRE